MSDPIFVANASGGAKKRKKKKMVQLEEEDDGGAQLVQQEQTQQVEPVAVAEPVQVEEKPVVEAPAPVTAPVVVSAPMVAAPAAEKKSEPEPARADSPVRADSEDEGDFNPLAEAMSSSVQAVTSRPETAAAPVASFSAASVPAPAAAAAEEQKPKPRAAPKKKSNLALVLSSSKSPTAVDDDDSMALSSFANTSSNRSTASAASSASASAAANRRPRDEFDDDLDIALGSMGGSRGGVTATSSGYIDPSELRAIEALQKRNKAKEDGFDDFEEEEGKPAKDEFEDEFVQDVADKQTLAASKSNQFDEFGDVWSEAETAMRGANNSGAAGGAPVRKVLKASRDQKAAEKPDAKEEARLKKEKELKAALEEADRIEAERKQLESEGLNNPMFAKLGLAPTNILAQYDTEKAERLKAVQAKPEETEKAKKKKRDQDQLESNDAALAAQITEVPPASAAAVSSSSASSSSSSSVAVSSGNTVEALVAAHTSGAALDVSKPEVAAELNQWGAVNELREKQEQAAREDAERAAKQGKQIGVKAGDNITRDTPIHYDAALRSLTVAPSCPSSSPNGPPPSTAVQLQLLKEKITIHDFRNVGMARRSRYSVFGAPSLKTPKLEEERNLMFCMALMKMDYEHCVDHERILCSLYRGLTGDPLAPPTFGSHWQIIGFQDKDPATDLRGAGLLSLIQLLYFLKNYKDLMLRIYALSQDDRQNFPFCTLSTNLTGMVLQCLRECYKIYGEINRQGSVFEVCNTLYCAAFYEMYLKWKNENCTIVNWSDVKDYVEDLVLHNPKHLIAKFKANNVGDHAAISNGSLEFTEIP